MTKQLMAVVLAFASAAGVSACATRGETVGTVGGAAVGAALRISVSAYNPRPWGRCES